MSLEIVKNLNSQKIQCSQVQSTHKKINFSAILSQETSFCTYRKGSLTVEAAVILPLMMGFFVLILFLFRVLFVQAAIDEALLIVGRGVAVESCFMDSDTALYISAEALLKTALLEDVDVERYVVGGVLGVSLIGSDFSGKDIELTANYLVKFPIQLFGESGIWLTSQNYFGKWVGDLYTDTGEEEWVYITETGTVYHKDTSCRSLDLSIQEGILAEMSELRGSNGQRYYACDRCVNTLEDNTPVYYTDYGRLYHESLECSALKRTILRVLLSQVGERPPCSFCY